MKLYIKQSVFTLQEKFTVKDELGNDVFFVEGSFMSIPKKYNIYDVDGHLVCEIEKQMFRMFSHFNVWTKAVSLTLKRNFSFMYTSISIEGQPWKLEGDFFGHNYEVMYGASPIMSINKHWFTWGDSYELNVQDDEDALLCLAIVIVVDRIMAENQSN